MSDRFVTSAPALMQGIAHVLSGDLDGGDTALEDAASVAEKIGSSALTAAELHRLPMLSTHLSIPEIAEEMFLSRNTIKTEVSSIYRKLGASSRNRAVTRSRELGLLAG